MTRILLVDDEPETLMVMRTFLDLSGFETVTTPDPQNAILLAEIEKPNCVLLDVMMPRINGFELCQMMRAHPVTSNLPIMFVTAYNPVDLEDRRKQVGADMVLNKPFGMDDLVDSVNKLMSFRQIREEDAPQPFLVIDPATLLVAANAPAETFTAAFRYLLTPKAR
jgi:CheY-like chemotaxis protein